MILNSQPKQFRLQDDGHILWQADPSNPLPGVAVARVQKGKSILEPGLALVSGAEPLAGQEEAAIAAFIAVWLKQHIAATLPSLVASGTTSTAAEKPEEKTQSSAPPEETEKETEAAKETIKPIQESVLAIALKLRDGLGLALRQEIEPQIAALGPEGRKLLRQCHVRLGPLLVFVPELNKPAAVRLRALLWWLWNGRVLPAPVPRDGVVSVVVDESQIDPAYQRAIGYPVYGGRAIRADMLDRLVCAVYDGAKGGAFKATHTMAEWLGAPIPDLYKVLEAMGHKKTHDPAEQTASAPGEEPEAKKEEQPAQQAEEQAVTQSQAISAEATAETPPEMVVTEQEPEQPVPAPAAVKPELATFRLRRGKGGDGAQARQRPRKKKPVVPPPFEKLTEEELRERAQRAEQRRKEREGKAEKRPPRKPPREGKPRPERVALSFEAKPAQQGESPFAMLQQLKVSRKD